MTILDTLTAEQVMRTPVLFATGQESLRDAAMRMHTAGLRCLLVLPTEPGSAPGILTIKDLVQAAIDEGESWLDELVVADVMTQPAVCVQAELRLRDCVRLMRMAGIRRVPVQRGTETIGILSTTDVLRRLVEDQH